MKDKKQQIFWFIYGFIATLCILIFVIYYSSLFVNASSSRNPLPLTNYTAPRYLTDEEIAFFNQMIQDKPSLFGNHSVDLTSDGIYCFNVQLDNRIVNTRQWSNVMGYVFYKPYSYSVENIAYDSFDLYSTSTIELYFAGFESWQFWQTAPGFSSSYNGWYGSYGSQGNSTTISLFGLGNVVTIQDPYHSNSFVQGYPIYWSSALYNGTSSVPIVNQPLLAYGKPGYTVQEGSATNPNFDSNNNTTSDGSANQPNTPTFPIFVLPQIDTSTIETLLESLIDSVKAFADFVGECFSVFFSWLVGVIQNGIQSIINTIREQTQFLYDNFVSLFKAISDNVSYLVEPLDQTEINNAFLDTSFYGIYDDYISFFTTFENYINNASEAQEFVIPIHLENLSYFNLQTYYLNLGSHFLPIRSALRAFLWVLCSVGAVFVVERGLSDWLRGENDT